MSVIYTATVGGKDYGFEFDMQIIDVDATIDNMLVTDLWTAIKEAQAASEGMSYDQIATGGGTDVLSTGIETFLTVTLLDNWEINTLKSSGKFEVSGGNLIRDDQADPFLDNPLITYISFLSQAGVATVTETGVSGLTASESTQLASITDITDKLPDNNIMGSSVTTDKDDEIDAIKAKTDNLTFTGTDVQVTLDGEEVTTDAASRTASQADVSSLSTTTDLNTVNEGVQKASKLIPHDTDL
jgi:hypothetical protein